MKSILTCVFLASVGALGAETLISQVVGQAGEQVITSREVQINYFCEAVLFLDEKSPQSPILEVSNKKFDKEINRVLIEHVVSSEADVFAASPVPEEDITKAVSAVKQAGLSSPHEAFWARLAPTTAELKRVVGRKLRAKKFIQFKSRASVVPVTDAEALQYFQKNKGRFGGSPFSQFKESIKSYLAQEQASVRIREWFEILQRKYKVRRVAAGD